RGDLVIDDDIDKVVFHNQLIADECGFGTKRITPGRIDDDHPVGPGRSGSEHCREQDRHQCGYLYQFSRGHDVLLHPLRRPVWTFPVARCACWPERSLQRERSRRGISSKGQWALGNGRWALGVIGVPAWTL